MQLERRKTQIHYRLLRLSGLVALVALEAGVLLLLVSARRPQSEMTAGCISEAGTLSRGFTS